MSEIIRSSTVVEEDTGTERLVIRDCRACLTGSEVYGCGVLSPTGIAHIGMDGGNTKCGKDATRDGWWWPM